MERPVRSCDVCEQLDDHPRHVAMFRNGRVVTSTTRHIDCCASQGCDVCTASLQEHGDLRGQELIDHLTALRGE